MFLPFSLNKISLLLGFKIFLLSKIILKVLKKLLFKLFFKKE
jgi:hypothetical protein